MIDQPSLAILIDCWILHPETHKGVKWYTGDYPNTPAYTAYRNIVNFLESNESIQTVVLASYNARREIGFSKDIWYNNYKTVFRDNKSLRKIRDLEHIHRVFVQQDNRFPDEKTHPIILNYTNDTKFQIAMLWGWELEYYLSLYPEIKNVYVLGVAWDQCVKNRPLGYDALLEIPNINVLTHTDCSAMMDGSPVILESDLAWEKITDKIYCARR